MSDPVTSVIICTRDRPRQLLACVAAVAQAAERCPELSTEIIVLENLSKPHLALDEAEVLQAACGRGRFVKLAVGGLSNARNAGMTAARGQLLVFTDDDCIMDRDYMRDLARHRARQPGHLFLGGRVKLGDPTDLPFTIKDDPVEQTYDVSIHPGGFVPGCNLVLSRQSAAAIGSFDTDFGAGAPYRAGEDTDYIIRGHLAGVPVRYVPDMCVLHYHGRKDLADVERLSQGYSFANGALYGKYIRQPWLLKHLYWSVRSAMRERLGGPAFNCEIGLSWSAVARANLTGFFAYMSRHGQSRLLSRRPGAPLPRPATPRRQDD